MTYVLPNVDPNDGDVSYEGAGLTKVRKKKMKKEKKAHKAEDPDSQLSQP